MLRIIKTHDKVAFIDRANSGKVKVRGAWMQLHVKGTPDLIGFTKNGQFIGIELKRPDTKNNANEDQVLMQNLMEKSNCIHGIAYDLDSLYKILDNIE